MVQRKVTLARFVHLTPQIRRRNKILLIKNTTGNWHAQEYYITNHVTDNCKNVSANITLLLPLETKIIAYFSEIFSF